MLLRIMILIRIFYIKGVQIKHLGRIKSNRIEIEIFTSNWIE